jgi:hypothetical protein
VHIGACLLANPRGFTHNSHLKRLGDFMRAVRSTGPTLGLLLATALSCSLSPTAGWAYTPEQEQACTNDAFRLCGSAIPDVDRVTACMIARKAELSPGCRVYFRDGPEPVANTGTPMNIRPSARKHVAPKHVTPHKRKKPTAG